MKVLIIEDSVRLLRSISMGLRKAGFMVDVSSDGLEGLWFIESYDYDVVILDLMLPGIDGLSILKKVRNNSSVSIIILSAKDTVEDRVKGLKLGADDYLIKPFAFEELLARVQALIRRKYSIKNNIIVIGDIIINLNHRSVSRNGKEIPLPPREYSLFEYLAMNKGRVVSRVEIEEHIYDENTNLMSNAIDVAISNLRKKIDEPGIIKTRRGQGFIINE